MFARIIEVASVLTRFRTRADNESYAPTQGLPSMGVRRVSRRVYMDVAFRVEMVVMSGMVTRMMRGDEGGVAPPLLAGVLQDIERMQKISAKASRTLRDRLYNSYEIDGAATYLRLAEAARQAKVRLSPDGVSLR
ncbi:hypothetical protein [Chitinolyticbacter albus]|uniref:hypothetical protein n=1 Tax=Chitinolyticbacter albus TaxID=2961951 RepID=UPI00210C3984|nr:hypothetical protein [Chitinolyticbacter albus]